MMTLDKLYELPDYDVIAVEVMDGSFSKTVAMTREIWEQIKDGPSMAEYIDMAREDERIR